MSLGDNPIAVNNNNNNNNNYYYYYYYSQCAYVALVTQHAKGIYRNIFPP